MWKKRQWKGCCECGVVVIFTHLSCFKCIHRNSNKSVCPYAAHIQLIYISASIVTSCLFTMNACLFTLFVQLLFVYDFRSIRFVYCFLFFFYNNLFMWFVDVDESCCAFLSTSTFVGLPRQFKIAHRSHT